MGKRRKLGTSKPVKRKVNKKDIEFNAKDSLLDPTDRSFVYDEADDYNDEKEEAALKRINAYKRPKLVEKEQVLGVGGDSDSDDSIGYSEDDTDSDASKSDEDKLFMEDDIVDDVPDTLTDERDWGNKKKLYYGTNTSDAKIKKNVKRRGKGEYFKLEEEAARRFQDRILAQSVNLPDDFLQDEDIGKKEEKIEAPVSSSAKSQEFIIIVRDVREKCREMRDVLEPLMAARMAGELHQVNIEQYIVTRHQIMKYYITNVCAYLMFKSELGNVTDHPVITRLTYYTKMLQKLDVINKSIGPKLEEVALLWKEGKPLGLPDTRPIKSPSKNKKKLLNVFSKSRQDKKIAKQTASGILDDSEDNDEKDLSKSRKTAISDSDDDKEISDAENDAATQDDDDRRAITYEMTKNKGLMPCRRKDLQNPRVRYRMKYKKKLKQRKGQVREVRHEVKKYSGEISGINAHVIKSVKLK